LKRTTGHGGEGLASGSTLVLRILPGSAPIAFTDVTSGYSVGKVLASVFCGRVEELARRLDSRQRENSVIFGYVIAHELGPLLLGTNSHSAVGVMRAT